MQQRRTVTADEPDLNHAALTWMATDIELSDIPFAPLLIHIDVSVWNEAAFRISAYGTQFETVRNGLIERSAHIDQADDRDVLDRLDNL